MEYCKKKDNNLDYVINQEIQHLTFDTLKSLTRKNATDDRQKKNT